MNYPKYIYNHTTGENLVTLNRSFLEKLANEMQPKDFCSSCSATKKGPIQRSVCKRAYKLKTPPWDLPKFESTRHLKTAALFNFEQPQSNKNRKSMFYLHRCDFQNVDFVWPNPDQGCQVFLGPNTPK